MARDKIEARVVVSKKQIGTWGLEIRLGPGCGDLLSHLIIY